jgi:cytochrome c oxidase assembly protein subunit 15
MSMTGPIDAIAFARLAVGPLVAATALLTALWWRRSLRGRAPLRQLAAITGLTLFLCFDLVAFGAYTRLTDSGLGCPDWPGCYAQASPVGAASPIAQEEAQRPTGPVTERKAWIEMIHRYLAMTVGALIIAMLVLAVRARASRAHAWRWALATLGWVLVQGLFGALTVTWKLYPAVVTGHLLGGIGLVALLAWQRALYRRSDADEAREAGRPSTAPRLRGDRLAIATAAAVLLVQIALGGWVSTNYAVLACSGFPGCNGHAWPAVATSAWREGFTFLRELGHRADGGLLSFDALVAIHWTHRVFAVVAVATLAALAFRFRYRPAARRVASTLAALLVLQVATGLSNVVLGWPLAAAVAHTAGAAALVVALCMLATHLRDRAHELPARAAPRT